MAGWNSRLAQALTVFGFLVSCGGVAWLLGSEPEGVTTMKHRVGFSCALLCCITVVVLSWSSIVANIATRFGWEQKTCDWLTLAFFGSPAAALLLFSNAPHVFTDSNLIFLCVLPASRLVKTLAFPAAKFGRVPYQEFRETQLPQKS